MKTQMTAVVVAVGLALIGPGSAVAGPKGCPPGLAKKAVPCVPPGLAKQRGWGVGDELPHDVRYIFIDDWDRYGLRRPDDGTRYVRVDNEVLRVALATRRIVESLGVIADVLN
jgi:hypothetical protein